MIVKVTVEYGTTKHVHIVDVETVERFTIRNRNTDYTEYQIHGTQESDPSSLNLSIKQSVAWITKRNQEFLESLDKE